MGFDAQWKDDLFQILDVAAADPFRNPLEAQKRLSNQLGRDQILVFNREHHHTVLLGLHIT